MTWKIPGENLLKIFCLVDVPIYILGPSTVDLVEYYSKNILEDGGEVYPNVLYLGKGKKHGNGRPSDYSEDELEILVVINLFHTTGLFLYPLKTSENLWFFMFSRGYRKTPVA